MGSRLGSVLWRCHRLSQTLCQFLCPHHSLCMSLHHRYLALLHTPSTQVLREEDMAALVVLVPLVTAVLSVTAAPLALLVMAAMVVLVLLRQSWMQDLVAT